MARSAFRSVSYDLEASLETAAIAVRAGGSVAPATLAAALGYSGVRNGAYLARLASARCFGLVSSRTAAVVATERALAALSSDAAAARSARIEAVLAVPLFRAVFERLAGRRLPATEDLAALLVDAFGEQPARAPAVAAKLVASVVQAGGEAAVQAALATHMTRGVTEFTGITEGRARDRSSELRSGRTRRGRWMPSPVPPNGRPSGGRAGGAGMAGSGGGRRWWWSGRSGGDERADEAPVYLEDEPARLPRARGATALRAAAAAVVVAAVAIPAGLVVSGTGAHVAVPSTSTSTATPARGGTPGAARAVLGALSATTASGSFDMSYRLTQTEPRSNGSTTTTCVPVPAPGGGATGPSGTVAGGATPGGSGALTVGAGSVPVTVPAAPPTTACFHAAPAMPTMVTGSGIIDVHPYAMVATAQLGTEGPRGNPTGGLSVSVRVDATKVWELSGGDGGLAPTPVDGQSTGGTTLSQFSGVVGSSLGEREGPVAVLAMASPTGYLDLAQNEVTSADQVGTATVDGQAATTYAVPITPAAEASLPGTSTEEQAAIEQSLKQLASLGYTGTTDLVSVGTSGYILRSEAIAHFTDGASVTLTSTFADFGCAGTVLMPGQQGSGVPPAGCTSPVVTVPSSTTTTTASGPTTTGRSSTTTTASGPTTTGPPTSG